MILPVELVQIILNLRTDSCIFTLQQKWQKEWKLNMNPVHKEYLHNYVVSPHSDILRFYPSGITSNAWHYFNHRFIPNTDNLYMETNLDLLFVVNTLNNSAHLANYMKAYYQYSLRFGPELYDWFLRSGTNSSLMEVID